MQTNALYYGDNLDILRRYLPDAAFASAEATSVETDGEPRRIRPNASSQTAVVVFEPRS